MTYDPISPAIKTSCRAVVCFAALALAVACSVRATLAEQESFPLMAWDYAKDEATLQAMHDCGINAIAFVPPHMLDACQRHGLARSCLTSESRGPTGPGPLTLIRPVGTSRH